MPMPKYNQISIRLAYGSETLAKWCRDPDKDCPLGGASCCPFCHYLFKATSICRSVTPEMWKAIALAKEKTDGQEV